MKKIVLLSDGTGNAAASVWRTNVWRISESLQRDNTQIVMYDDGVGTSSPFTSILGLIFGRGLKRNVLHLYEFLCRSYSPGDEIFVFGFSRGAFTIYTLIGMVANQGLVPFRTEGELKKRAEAAYRNYRIGKNRRTIWDFWRRRRSLYDVDFESTVVPEVKFVGLWDTVAAYGLPIDEMARGLSRWFYPLRIPNRQLPSIVKRGCHALSLDDERLTFHPMLWDESDEVPAQPDENGIRNIRDERLTQVWFSGVHANVGGGYPDDSLAHVSFCWMLDQAAQSGLRFKTRPKAEPDTFKFRRSLMDPIGRLYDSRKGFQRFYRYRPRKVLDLCNNELSDGPEDRVKITAPKIHHSVFERIESGIDLYFPKGLPRHYEVVGEDGAISPSAFETKQQARARSEAQEVAWDYIWWKRLVNFSITAAVAFTLLYPLLYSFPRIYEFTSPLRPISDLVRVIGAFLPAFTDLWINAYARLPSLFVFMLVTVFILTRIGATIRRSIADETRQSWQVSRSPENNKIYLPNSLTYRLRTSLTYKINSRIIRLRILPAFYAAATAALAIELTAAIVGRSVIVTQDANGFYCTGSLKPLPLRVLSFEFKPSDLCQRTGFEVKAGQRYVIEIRQKTPWSKQDVPTSLAGYSISDIGLASRLVLAAATPFRRSVSRPWFTVILRVGEIGSEEYFLEPDPFDTGKEIRQAFMPQRSGELFLYVNDIVNPFPPYDLFYKQNLGTADVLIRER